MNAIPVLSIVTTLTLLAVLVTASTVLTPTGRGVSLTDRGFRMLGFLLVAAIVAVIAHALSTL